MQKHTWRSFHKMWGLSKARCFDGCKREVFAWITVKDVKNASCWFAVKANNNSDLKLFAVMTCWSFWHRLMTFCWVVLTPQYHMKVSFCKLPSFCRRCRRGNDWKRRWKIGHSCSLYFPNIPPPPASSTPASLLNPTSSATPSSWHTPRNTHIHYSLSADFQTLCSTCLFSRCEGMEEVKKKKKNASHSGEHVLARGGD